MVVSSCFTMSVGFPTAWSLCRQRRKLNTYFQHNMGKLTYHKDMKTSKRWRKVFEIWYSPTSKSWITYPNLTDSTNMVWIRPLISPTILLWSFMKEIIVIHKIFQDCRRAIMSIFRFTVVRYSQKLNPRENLYTLCTLHYCSLKFKTLKNRS